MTRIKRGTLTHRRHKNILSLVKGYRRKNGNVYKLAKNAVMKAGENAYIGRRLKKRTFRRLWNVRINNALRPFDMKYSVFIHNMTQKNIKLNRKVLSNMAISHPEVFAEVVKTVKG
ncbi:50S ribosomal protein L20 [Candidatus Gracilibacteria bacterium]|nr:MAG: 50S ribosomal protein L20 [Candidatus Gracilibacteria bacterium]